MKRLITYKEAAKEYGPSEWYWRNLVWTKKIKHLGTEGRHLLDRKDIEKFIESEKRIAA